MNVVRWFYVLFVSLVAAGGCLAQQADAATNGVPSQAEIDAFVKRYEGAGEVWELKATFRLPTFPPAAWRLYQNASEKIPYHLTAVLTRSGGMVLDKDIEVFIVDAEDKPVECFKVPLDTLCPS